MSKKGCGKLIYKPQGKAAEYCTWACNLYTGCSNCCTYCYNRHSIGKAILGADTVSLKVRYPTDDATLCRFVYELNRYRSNIKNEGNELFFNFVSDPCLPETIELNFKCIGYAATYGVDCKILTKRADWYTPERGEFLLEFKDNIKFGFTITGADELEPYASPNSARIALMKQLHDMGIKTWASFEPIINPEKTYELMLEVQDYCDEYKLGILNGDRQYKSEDIKELVEKVQTNITKPVYIKKNTWEFINKQKKYGDGKKGK